MDMQAIDSITKQSKLIAVSFDSVKTSLWIVDDPLQNNGVARTMKALYYIHGGGFYWPVYYHYNYAMDIKW